MANAGNNSITTYSWNGFEFLTLNVGVSNPQAVAFDAIGDLRVNNSFQTLAMFPITSQPVLDGPQMALPGAPTTIPGQYTQPFTAVASGGG